MAPMVLAAPDPRLDRIPERLFGMVKYAVAQWRQPRVPAGWSAAYHYFRRFYDPLLKIHHAGVSWNLPGFAYCPD